MFRRRLNFKSKVRVDGSKFERRLSFLKSPPDTDDARYLACVSKEAKLRVEGSRRWFEVRKKTFLPFGHLLTNTTRDTFRVSRKRLSFKSKVRVDGSKFERRLSFLKSPPDTDDARYFSCVSKEAKLHVEGSRRWLEV